ncbi:MAG: protein TolQ [Asticcacaulis sp.]
MSETLSPDSFNAVTLFLHADWVVKGVMIAMAVASLWSWMIIIDKALRLGKLNKEASQFEAMVNTGRSLDDIALQVGDQPNQPQAKLLVLALREWRENKSKVSTAAQGDMLVSRLDRELNSVINRESDAVEDGLSGLAIVATASPFVGLFGTVWGIMHAFNAIAAQGNTSLTTVAPAIAEALFATAIGLAAAIPAYVAYNKFNADAARFSARMEAFADDLMAALSRRLADKLSDKGAA